MPVRICISIGLVVECLVFGGCVEQASEVSLKVSEVVETSETFGLGAPSWLTQADYEDYEQTISDKAKDLGLSENPPAIVRWIRPDEWAAVMGGCLADQGMIVEKIDTIRSELVANPPLGQETLRDYAWWVCFAKYPQMPDSEHGVYSERTKRILYEWAAVDLVACLSDEGFHDVRDIPSYEVFWERFFTDRNWHPYDYKVFQWAMAQEIDIEAKCPQWPTDGRLDYQYHEEK